MFSHLKLRVYGKALASVTRLGDHAAGWDKRHAVVDQLVRASESIILNIAESARIWSVAQKQHQLDYAIGSVLECAACLDIAVVKEFLSPDSVVREKELLSEVVRMLVGLRQSWGEAALRENTSRYGEQTSGYFAHEQLKAYQVGLEFVAWFHHLPAGAELASRLYRQVDKAATSMVLNVAEGNGRYSAEDQRRFLEIAEGSAVKAAAYLDLCQSKAELDSSERERGVDFLGRIALLIRGLWASCGSKV